MKYPFLKIIIPVYNDWDRLIKCLNAIESQNYPESKFEVVVVDNGSNHLPEIPAFNFPLEVKTCLEKGSYAARNYGLKDQKAEVLVFTDSDCIPGSKWLVNGVKAFSKNIHIVAGRIEVFAANPEHPSTPELFDIATAFPQKRYVEKRSFGVTANLFIKNEVFQSIGYFNNKLKSGGDTEFCRRAVSNGYSIKYSESAVVKHPARKTVGEIYSKVQRMTGGRLDRYDNQLNKFFSGFKFIKPPVRGFFYVFSSAKLSFLDRIRASSILFVIWFASINEWVRIVLFRSESKRL